MSLRSTFYQQVDALSLGVAQQPWREVHGMCGNDDSGEFYYFGIEAAADRLVESSAVTRAQVEGALGIVRTPGFVLVSPLSLTMRGPELMSRDLDRVALCGACDFVWDIAAPLPMRVIPTCSAR